MAPGELVHRRPAGRPPPWPPTDDPIASMQPFSALPISGVAGFSGDVPPRLLGQVALAALHCFLPPEGDSSPDAPDDAYSSDEFRMYEFKIRRCPRGRSHDWTECPYAHPGEKARRRDPLRVNYSGSACPDFRRGCRRGDACHLAHGVFETWLHPARYRTQPCKDGAACPRRVCFFAHSPEELRIVLPSSPTSPGKGDCAMSSSPTSTLTMTLPPASPRSDGSSPPLSPMAIDEVVAAMTKLQLSRVRSGTPFGTRRGGEYASPSGSVPPTPVRRTAAAAAAAASAWGFRATLSDYCQMREQEEEAPDFGWVTELVKD